jgi:hypothetical protein
LCNECVLHMHIVLRDSRLELQSRRCNITLAVGSSSRHLGSQHVAFDVNSLRGSEEAEVHVAASDCAHACAKQRLNQQVAVREPVCVCVLES